MSFALSPVKTIEFKLNLNSEQKATIDRWLGVQKFIWNDALFLVNQQKSFTWYNKNIEKLFKKHEMEFKEKGLNDKDVLFPCCPAVWWDFLVYKDKKQKDEKGKPKKIFAPYSRYSVNGHRSADNEEWRPCCPLPPYYQEPEFYNAIDFNGLTGYLTQARIKKRHPDKPWIVECPMAYIKGTLDRLADAWKAYTKGIRKRPKYKGKRDKVTTLTTLQGDAIKIEGDRIKLPGIKDKVKAKTLDWRWPVGLKVSVLEICKCGTDYYLHLTGEVPVKKPVKRSDKACGLDVGLEYIYSDDNGKQVDPPKYYRQAEKRLRRLQRKIARQQNGSANQKKTARKIAKLHDKTKRRRRSFNHKLSTYVVRTFGGIAVEDIQIKNLMRRPEKKEREDGNGYERNNAKAKSGLNKSFADAGLGQLLTMIEQKASAADREFERVPAAYTSQICPACKNQVEKSLSQRTHRCGECGYIAPRDVAAAINIREKANFLRVYRACPRNVKPVEPSIVKSQKPLVGEQKQESQGELFSLSEVSNDVGTTFQPHLKRTRRRKTRSAQTDSVIQLQLGLWGSALAESS